MIQADVLLSHPRTFKHSPSISLTHRERGLKVGGTKKDLVHRLEHPDEEEEEQTQTLEGYKVDGE